jgi:hypothetical protein
MLFLLTISIGRILLLIVGKGGKLTKSQHVPELRGAKFYTLSPFDLDKDGDPEWLDLGITS